jgi:hypothetical protein
MPIQLRAFSVLVAILFCACGGGIPLDEDAVFQPRESLTPGTFAYENATLEEVFFEAEDGTRLNAWHIDRDESVATVLYFGGQGFNLVLSRAFVSEMLAEVPVDLFMVDYRGYGRSGGEPSVEKLKSDAVRAHEFLTERRGVDPATIVVHGHSMGTFVASYVATRKTVAALVMESGVTDVDGWTRALVPWYLRLFLKFDVSEALAEESNLERIRQIEVPTLFLVGSNDPITPPELSEKLHRESAADDKQLVEVEGGDHNGLYEYEAYRDAYEGFARGL